MLVKGSYRPFCKFANHLYKSEIKLQNIKNYLWQKSCPWIHLNVQNFLYFIKKNFLTPKNENNSSFFDVILKVQLFGLFLHFFEVYKWFFCSMIKLETIKRIQAQLSFSHFLIFWSLNLTFLSDWQITKRPVGTF